MQLSDTTDIHALTAKLGLTLNESEVYFFLLKHGLMYGADIFTQLGMDKSSCYRALTSLQEKGLVYKVGEERNQKFGASDSDMLLNIAQAQQHDLKQTSRQLKTLIEELKQGIGNHYLKKNITVIEGQEGYKLMMEDRLRSKNKLIRELGGRKAAAKQIDDYDGYIGQYIKRRVKQEIWLQQLVPFGEIDNKWERSSKKLMKEARELPREFESGALLSTWDYKSGFFSKEGKTLIGFVVKDPLITNLMNSMFDYIWKSSN